jgi:nicotinamidase-related amidase
MRHSQAFQLLVTGSVGIAVALLLWTPNSALSAQGGQAPLSQVIAAEHTVLLVHEVLNAFVSEGGWFEERGERIDITGIMDPMVKLIAAARENGVRVAYVRWTTYPDYSNYGPPRDVDPDAPVAANQMHEGTWGWENPPEIAPAPFDWILRKYRSDAFIATPLDELLRWNEITTIVIVGVGAEVGVVPTLSTAEILGYDTVAVEDAIRPTEPHRLADAMLYINDHARVVTHTDVIDAWNGQ